MFDPSLPADHTKATAAEMRDQLNGLKDLIDAVPVIADATVDAVNTLPAGEPAAASAGVVASTLHFTFDIPQGDPGPQGPPFAGVVVDATNTLPPGSPATVDAAFDGTNVVFTFGIPTGDSGVDGLPGEVSAADLGAAIDGTSSNSNGVAPLGLVVSDPPSQAELQAVADKLDELINTLHR